MKTIVTADLHLGLKSDSVLLPSGIPSQVDLTLRRLTNMIGDGYSTIIVAGDLFDKVNPESYIIAELFKVFDYAAQKEVFIYIIAGNHDCSSMFSSTDIPHWAGYENVDVILRPEFRIIEGQLFFFLPHMEKKSYAATVGHLNWKTFFEQEWELAKRKYDPEITSVRPVLITHGIVESKKYFPGSEVLMESGNAYFFKPTDFALFRQVFIGHVHKRMTITTEKTQIDYPGSVVMGDFGEVNNARGYLDVSVTHRAVRRKFFEFTDTLYDYGRLEIDLGKNGYPSSKWIKENVFPDLLKVVVYPRLTEDVDKVKLRKIVGDAGKHLMRLEIVRPQEKKQEVVSASPIVFDPVELLKSFLQEKETDKELLKLELQIGKRIIEECSVV